MYPVPAGWLDSIPRSQHVVFTARVTKGAETTVESLPILDGSITVSTSQTTRRTLSMSTKPRITVGPYRSVPTLDLVSNEGHEIWIEVVFGGAVIPLGVFKVDDIGQAIDGSDKVDIEGSSREAWLIEDRFEAPRTIEGPSAQSLITQMIQETLPEVDVICSASTDGRVPAFQADTGRWDEVIQVLADGIGAQVYASPWGPFVIADAPTLDMQPVWRIVNQQRGAYLTATEKRSRDDTYNAVAIRTDAAGSDAPANFVVLHDDDPTSPTRWGSPLAGCWGKKIRFILNPTITTIAQATTVAKAEIVKGVGASAALSFTSLPCYALEGNDVVDIVPHPDLPNTVRRHVVDQFGFSIAKVDFSGETRDLREVKVDAG